MVRNSPSSLPVSNLVEFPYVPDAPYLPEPKRQKLDTSIGH